MMDQEQGYVHYLYEKYQGRIAIGVGYDTEMEEIFPFVFESPKGNSLGIVALSAVQQKAGPVVYIFHFSTFNPNHGSGRIMIGELCRLADHYQVVLSLSPFTLPNGGLGLMNSKQLKSWYVSYGFGGNHSFRREPILPLSPLSA
ncbi:MAG: hypothetical protein WC799_04485 [Desulfobacteraceae bacterium]|jgi:hypothetical protein